jgi:hypothetical protein
MSWLLQPAGCCQPSSYVDYQPCFQASAHQARRRSGLDRLLRTGASRLRVVLALPHPDRPPRRRASGAGPEGREHGVSFPHAYAKIVRTTAVIVASLRYRPSAIHDIAMLIRRSRECRGGQRPQPRTRLLRGPRVLQGMIRFIGLVLFLASISFTTECEAASKRAIPDETLATPVLITLRNGSTGSGFYLSNGKEIFLVTAKHVLFDQTSNKLRDTTANLLSYSMDITSGERNILQLDLTILNAASDIKPHPSEDVVVVKIANLVEDQPSNPNSADNSSPNRGPLERRMSLQAGVAGQLSSTGPYFVTEENVLSFDQVLVGNDVIMFGYPTSLSLVANPKVDFQRPLLRKGIVAGKDIPARSVILDCASYQGDSGGPIVQVYQESPFERRFEVIGVVSSFVPFADTWMNQHFGYTNTTLENSGYSIATPMDFVLELIR